MGPDLPGKAEPRIGVFVLAKNEQANIGRCLESLSDSGWSVTVLDSGSTDATGRIVAGYEFATLVNYRYVDHCTAYNEITTDLAAGFRYTMILDADMIVSRALQIEIESLLSSPDAAPQVIESGIEMCVEGTPLKFGSLCPPKPFVFVAGERYFSNLGHAETLKAGVEVVRTRERLRHDDRKGYASYLQSQARYSRSLVLRTKAGQVSGRDRLRTRTPLLIAAVPFVSYFLKGGLLAGKAGVLYALDRLIAEAIMYRRSLSGNVDD